MKRKLPPVPIFSPTPKAEPEAAPAAPAAPAAIAAPAVAPAAEPAAPAAIAAPGCINLTAELLQVAVPPAESHSSIYSWVNQLVTTMGEQHTSMLLQQQGMAHEHALDIVNVISENMRQNMMQACASSASGSNDPWYPIANGPASPPTTITRYVVRDPGQIPPFKAACPSPPAEARAKKGATYNRAAPYISQTGKAKAAAVAAADWVAAQAAADTAAAAAKAAAAAAAVIPVPTVHPPPVLPPPIPVPPVRRPAPTAPTPAPSARRGGSSGGR